MYADPNKKLRTLVLSPNVNDYDTGEPVLEGSIIRKTVRKNKKNLLTCKVSSVLDLR
jgi:hypothetical protein